VGYFLIADFKGGLDVRRMSVASAPGTLRKLVNGHLNRGGEIEQAPAWIAEFDLPADTFGLAASNGRVYTFGSKAVTIPFVQGASILPIYQRLQHPAGAEMIGVESVTFFGGKPYVVARYADGTVFHFYDGVQVPAWVDGRARTSFQVTAAAAVAAAPAAGTIKITGGTLAQSASALIRFSSGWGASSRLSSFKVGGVELLSSTISGVNASTLTASRACAELARQINAKATTPDYSAVANGEVITITAVTAGTAANGKVISWVAVDAEIEKESGNMAGGVNGSTLSSVKVAGVELLDKTITLAGSVNQMAIEVANRINASNTTPRYAATSLGDTVTVKTYDIGTAGNGRALTIASAGGLTTVVSPVLANGRDQTAITSVKIAGVEALNVPVVWTGSISQLVQDVADQINLFTSVPDYGAIASNDTLIIVSPSTAAGALAEIATRENVTLDATSKTLVATSTADTYRPATYVKTAKQKVYALAESLMHFSALNDPTLWTEDDGPPPTGVGAGFVNLANSESGSERLYAVANYFNNLAIFARRAVQIWFVDVDDAQNQQIQVINQTGTIAARSVVEFGDNDVFYLSDSGIRSLRARDSSNAAFVNDVGTSIDPMILDVIRAGPEDAYAAVGVVEPRDGRYLLAIGDKVYVFSFFPASKVSGWSVYEPGFTVSDFAVDGLVVLARSGDRIYSLGGYGDVQFDDKVPVLELPFLDAGKPATSKRLQAIDIACEGVWEAEVALDPLNPEESYDAAVVTGTTYSLQRIKLVGHATHISLRLKGVGAGPHRLSNIAIHFDDGEKG
jgi:hypothetical protein